MSPDTVAVALGRGRALPGEPLNVPVHLASVFRAGGAIDYAREGNPTWEALEAVLGTLEGGRALTFASGLAAVAAVLECLPMGGTAVVPRDAYTGLRLLLRELAATGRLRTRPVDIAATDEVLAACAGADLLWVETPTNPLLALADLPALAEGSRAQGVPVAVDNTFATPLLQQPLAVGADVVVHSATKLLAGHSDVLLGATVTRDERWHTRLEEQRVLRGAVPGPMEAWLALRGVRTLPVRLERAQRNAGELALRLAQHPAVEVVRYPGLPDDPGHARAVAQLAGFGTIVTFDVVGGQQAADTVCGAVRLIVNATSLGGVETTMERRGRQHGEEALPAGLIRLSVGCEDVDDLWEDLAGALDEARP